MNLPFDQAVSYYDQTRSDPDWVMDRVAQAFLRETHATHESSILEVGIGTGRIAFPLLERGLHIVGVDLSRPMMNGLQKKVSGRAVHVALLQADAAILPFPNDGFDIVYGVHIYHLVPNWQNALHEARRVLKRGGCMLVSFHYRSPDSPNRKIRQKLAGLALEQGVDASRPGAKSDQEIRKELEKWKWNLRVIEVARWKELVSPAQVLADIEARIYSDVWLISPELQKELTPRLNDWADREFKDLSRPIETDSEFNWLIVEK